MTKLPLKADSKLNFNIVAPMSSADGYGYSAEELIRASYEDHGANIGYVPHDWQDRRFSSSIIDQLEQSDWSDKEVLLVYFIPYAFYHFKSEFNIGMTMFETTEIPDVWAQFCMHTDSLIVPSEFCRQVFGQKVGLPIEVVPLGVNLNTYHMIEREESPVFTFLMAGLLHYRKGAEFAVRAFKDEFAKTEDVQLVLKTRRGFLDVGAESLDDPRIQVVNADYSREDMLSLYHAADAFIAPSRGEASGLTPREAMATGLPTIVTNWGGLTEIADPNYTLQIEVDGLEPAPPVCTSYDAGITQGQSIGNFCRPSVESLRQQMRKLYEDRDFAKRLGFNAAMWVQNRWNYRECSRQWLEAIERLYDNRN